MQFDNAPADNALGRADNRLEIGHEELALNHRAGTERKIERDGEV